MIQTMGKFVILLYSLMLVSVPYIVECFQGNYLHYLPFFLSGFVALMMLGLGDCLNEDKK